VDQLTWKHTNDGFYPVKSGYNQVFQKNYRCKASSISNTGTLWQKKYGRFKWNQNAKALFGEYAKIVFVRGNLQTKMDIDHVCPCCGEEYESLEYALLLRKEVQPIWFASPVSGRMRNAHQSSSNQWLVDCLQLQDEEFMKQIFGIIWSILLRNE